MPELAITDDVDHHILVEGLAIFDRNLGYQRHRFRIVTIDVEDRCIDHLEDVSAVMTGAIVTRVGCSEAHLVVDHDVQRTPYAVTARLREIEHFLVDTLASHRRIAVNEDGHHLLLAAFTAPYLAGIDRTFDHRIDDFQVRRIESQRQMARASRRGHIGGEAHVVLDIARRQIALFLAFEFLEQHRRGLAQGIDQHVEAATVGHANHNLINTKRTATADGFIHGNDQ